jgi:hypothetical protein
MHGMVAAQRVYLSGHPRELQESFDQTIKSRGYGWIPIIYEDFIDPTHDGLLDDDLLKKRIKELFPASNASGICVLNWETPTMERVAALKLDPDVYQKQVAEMVRALKIAKALRPRVKWGYYGLNIQEYYYRNDSWRSRTEGFLPVMEASDILFPSLYKFYPYSINGYAFEESYAKENIDLILQYGARLSKPVMPFVWPRFHDADPKFGLQSIPDKEWTDHIGFLAKPNAKGQQISGIVMWAMDVYYLQSSEVVKKEAGSRKPENYRQENLLHYLDLTYRTINN